LNGDAAPLARAPRSNDFAKVGFPEWEGKGECGSKGAAFSS
jgi:hypothetical protein